MSSSLRAESQLGHAPHCLPGSGGDAYAQRAGEVASNTGSSRVNETLSHVTNKIMSDSIAVKMGSDPQRLTTKILLALIGR